MKTIYLFDLYDTVLKDISFDFRRGMRYLYDAYFADQCSWDTFVAYEDTFLPLYEKRREDNSEVSFLRDEMLPIFAHFGVEPPEDPESLAYAVMERMQENTLTEEVAETLRVLSERDVPMYILSNAVFSARAAACYLEKFDALRYFTKIYSSADYGVRKPGREFFDLAVEDILRAHPECTREDITFVGNDYTADAAGGVLAGLRTVWYNVKNLPNTDQLPIREISDFRELLEEQA